MSSNIKKYIIGGTGLLITPFVLVIIDSSTGLFGGTEGDANIGLGMFGLLIWLISIIFFIKAGVLYALSKRKD